MNDFAYWLLREYGENGTITHINSTSMNLETGNEVLDQEVHELKMVLLPVTMVRTYAQAMRTGSDYGNLYAQGNSLAVLPTPEFTIHEDDTVHLCGFDMKVVDVQFLHHENLVELVVKS